MKEAAGLDNAAGHHGDSAFKKRDDSGMHHRGSRNSRKRAVREKSAETDRQEQKRFEALHDRQIHHDETERNHDELTDAVGHSEKRFHLVTGMESALLVEVAAVPLHILVVVAVAVGAQGLFRRAVGLVEVAGDVGGSFRLHKTGDTGVGGQILDPAERLFPRRFVGLKRKASDRHEHCHQNFFHILTVLFLTLTLNFQL